jgi:peroxiredoxin
MLAFSLRGSSCPRQLHLLAGFLLAVSAGWVAGERGSSDRLPAEKANSPGAGRRVKDFTLKDLSGRAHTSAAWKGHTAVVLLFLGTECPVSNGYAPEMTRLARAYRTRGVLFWGVHPDPDVTPADAARHARDYRLDFQVLLDPRQHLARQAGVRVTPEVVLLSPTGEILYRGRIDDKYTPGGKRRPAARTRDLEDALQAVLARKKVLIPRTRAFGCPLPHRVEDKKGKR